jgi:hypothetical protein
MTERPSTSGDIAVPYSGWSAMGRLRQRSAPLDAS